MVLFKKIKYIFVKSSNYFCLLDYSSADRFLTGALGGAVLQPQTSTHESRVVLDIITHYYCEERTIKLIVTGRHFW